ncbi:MAG: translation initiation factor IF-3 [Dissulfuribacterales bacterium]
MGKETININDAIKSDNVRLIGKDGANLGVVSIREALDRAGQEFLDLVEIVPNANPPVCRIMDFGKFKYEQSKKAQEAKKKQIQIQIKEIKLRPKTDTHDLEVKKKHIREFIEDGNKVKVTIRFRGREMMHKDIGIEILKKLVQDFSNVAVVEGSMGMEGPTAHIMLIPKKN